jgi:hypothetical protein
MIDVTLREVVKDTLSTIKLVTDLVTDGGDGHQMWRVASNSRQGMILHLGG